LARPGSRTLDFLFVGRGAFISIVGAVVMISGAGISLLVGYQESEAEVDGTHAAE
jgi:hypothetical protein